MQRANHNYVSFDSLCDFTQAVIKSNNFFSKYNREPNLLTNRRVL